jgi:hypothetical protein
MDLKLLKALELEAEAGNSEAEAREAELDLHEHLASQFETRQYFFDGELDFESLAACIDSLDNWRRLDARKRQFTWF